MKNTGYRQRNRKLQYQIAGTILVVACIGFALLYFWQKYDARQDALRQARIPRSRLGSFRSRRH